MSLAVQSVNLTTAKLGPLIGGPYVTCRFKKKKKKSFFQGAHAFLRYQNKTFILCMRVGPPMKAEPEGVPGPP